MAVNPAKTANLLSVKKFCAQNCHREFIKLLPEKQRKHVNQTTAI